MFVMFQDHIQEVLSKWQSIDDEIWAKIIVLERNRRVAKAYARAPVLTVNGSDDGFDGFRIGLAGFDNPMRDAKTEEVKRHIGQVSDDILRTQSMFSGCEQSSRKWMIMARLVSCWWKLSLAVQLAGGWPYNS